jgi:AcrR family transcriptional regulator
VRRPNPDVQATPARPRRNRAGKSARRTGSSRPAVSAAYDILEEEGLEGLTIRAVLKKTGLSRRAFYERFADKDELVLAVFEETIRIASRYYEAQLAAVPDPLARLELIVTSIVMRGSPMDADHKRSSHRGIAMTREHLRLAESRPQDLQIALSPLLDLLARLLAEGMQAGVVRQGSPDRLAHFVYNLVATTVHTEMLTESTQPNHAHRAQLAADLWEFCRRAIAA